MANKLKTTKREKVSPPKKKTSSHRASARKNLSKKQKSDEVEALAITWNEDLCE